MSGNFVASFLCEESDIRYEQWSFHQNSNMDAPLQAAATTAVLFAMTSLAYIVLPGWHTDGYACHWNGAPISYKLNGAYCLPAPPTASRWPGHRSPRPQAHLPLPTHHPMRYPPVGPLVLLLVVAVWAALAYRGSDLAYITAANFGASFAVANCLGLAASAGLVYGWPAEAPHRCLTVDQTQLRGQAAAGVDVMAALPASPPRGAGGHFFYGRAFNPQLLGVDVKMGLYTLGAAVLQWNLLSALALGARAPGGRPTLALGTYAGLLTWFIAEYLLLEAVHLYTYDIMCERVGFKLAWGCFAFYPYFYCAGVWALLAAPAADLTAAGCAATVATFLTGWVLTRGANLQKYVFKTRPEGTAFACGLVPNGTVPGTRLLCTGFWGLARHVNYLGEIVQAVGLALPASLVGAPPALVGLAWAYPLYYVALFVPRQIDDDEQIQLKYGERAFAEYTRRVPYRIVPGVW
jgi:hypothetical protein